MMNYIELMLLYKNIKWWPQVYNNLKEYEKKNKFKIVKVMKFTSKTISRL